MYSDLSGAVTGLSDVTIIQILDHLSSDAAYFGTAIGTYTMVPDLSATSIEVERSRIIVPSYVPRAVSK